MNKSERMRRQVKTGI